MYSFEGEFVFSTPLKVAKRQQLTLLNWSRFIFGAFPNWQIKQLFAFILKVIIWYLWFHSWEHSVQTAQNCAEKLNNFKLRLSISCCQNSCHFLFLQDEVCWKDTIFEKN